MEPVAGAQEEGLPSQEDAEATCEQLPPPAILSLLGQFTVMGAYSAVVLDTGDTANLVFSKWLDPYNSVLGKWAVAPADPFPARARFKFVGRSLGKARFSADVPAFLPRDLLAFAVYPRPFCRKLLLQRYCVQGRWNPRVGNGISTLLLSR